ncbi:MAG TPA: hypothetical protein VFI15_07350, partial [Candidatus Limnocylindrales bacterium]|nr:hypothetical protein [Candidatus Limnocylindrales bacterium]
MTADHRADHRAGRRSEPRSDPRSDPRGDPRSDSRAVVGETGARDLAVTVGVVVALARFAPDSFA